MTVAALLLRDYYFSKRISPQLMYAGLAVLFVNISIGGALTPYAAPPILMVASTWNWDLWFMLENFGWRSAVAVSANSTLLALLFYKELRGFNIQPNEKKIDAIPVSVICHPLGLLSGSGHFSTPLSFIYGLVFVLCRLHHRVCTLSK